MSFLAMILALILLHLSGASRAVHHDLWFRSWQGAVAGLSLPPLITLALCIALPAVLIKVLLNALEPLLFGLFWIAGAIVVLLYSFGRIDCDRQADKYLGYCRSGDFEGAYLYGQSHWDIDSSEDQLTSPEGVHTAIAGQLFYCDYQRWFPVLFYFLFLGPAGALAYRLLQLYADKEDSLPGAKVLHWVDWLPARLLAIGFAVTGDFIRSRDSLTDAWIDSKTDSRTVLLRVGRAATGLHEMPQNEASFATAAAREFSGLRALMTRAKGSWLIAVSLIVLLS